MIYFIYPAIALIVIFIIVSAIMRKRIYKEVDRLEEWKNGILNRDIPDEIGKVKRLQMSGQTEEKFETWRSEWDEIVGTILPDIEERLFDIEDYAAKNRFKKAQQELATTDQRLVGIEDQIKQLLEDVQSLVSSEEQNRTEIDEVRSAYKELFTIITKKRGSLGPGLTAFDENMDKINELFESFDQSTSDGSYLQARNYLLEATTLLKELEELIERYPRLLVQVETKIPAEVKEIQNGMEEMDQAGYQLEAFSIQSRLEMIEKELVKIKEDLFVLKCDGVEDKLTEMSNQIDQLYEMLEFEVESKQYVFTKLDELTNQVQISREKVEALFNETVDVQQSYFISDQQINEQKQMKENVHNLTNKLYVLCDLADNQKQTYTSIRDLVDEWQSEMIKLDTRIEQEKETLFALREDERKAKETLHSLQDTMVEMNRVLKKSNIPGLPNRALDQLQSAEEKIIDASNQLQVVPLELGRVNVLVEEATIIVEENSELIHEMIELAELVERVIQYGNRYRSRSEKVEAGLNEAELLFRQYEYEEALDCAVRVIEKYEPDVLNVVKEYLPV
ncbi:septation ring formation regulator EzrA [Halalkalibacter kiskunsagensis]|uniref:Septation ring formation regulator EzrA n=1 Tax=Halalkalibacter kiskunsagensis TaxID=1548599 RepID=A0ABV6KIU1_9BACI